ncbi:MAG: serine/threonine-protein kinase [Acidobacteria bacterium]|nr:serine/threonine-protein kinase [Acidobacteriota bacterium]
MALVPGTRLGVYEVTAQIGEGGMGQVFRARDTTLNRDIALKVLPDSFASDPDRLARFTREAQTLASLNHPNIAAIYGIEASSGVRALVMELVEGEGLSQRIARGAIPIDESLPIAKQIAEALEAAHEQGIIHRDLKPANIKVRPDGTVKVLDFGLAKALEPTGVMAATNSMSPTITTPAMTQAGMILGTAAYMSPEQARGRAVDKRADIWAFGAVLFEMLTGTRAFAGEDVSDVLASVLAREPDWARLPATLPPTIGTFLKRCLQKDSRQRLRDIGDARMALEGVFEPPAAEIGARAPDQAAVQQHTDAAIAEVRRVLARSMNRRVIVAGATAAIAGIVLTGASMWYATRPVPGPVVRTEIATAGVTALSVQGAFRDIDITPDGSRIVYRGQNQLLVRALDRLEPTTLGGLGAPGSPFVSPDGQWVGFFEVTAIKKVAIAGGPPVTLVANAGSASRGASWGEDGTIVFAGLNPAVGLLRVSGAGGDPTVLTTPNRESGEGDHLWPEFLPGGQALLFTITPATGGLDSAQTAVLDLQTGAQTVIMRGGHHARYVPSGHLVYGASGTLWAVAFDLARRAVVGTPVPVVEHVATTAQGGVEAVVAASGTLVYLSGGALTESTRTLVWVDREGSEAPVAGAPARNYTYPRVSPDGTQVALDVRDQEQDIWIWHLVRQTLTRFTFGAALDTTPVWTPDGKRLVWASRRAGPLNLYGQTADGTGAVERLTTSPNEQRASGVTPDGRQLLLAENESAELGAPQDLGIVPLDGDRRTTRLAPATFVERNGEVSPDGRWLAYESNESGTFQIYVRPFPSVDTGRWQVSAAGGRQPLWSRSGRELFYWGPDGALMATAVAGAGSGGSFAAGASATVVKAGYYTAAGTGNLGRTYDVSPDGQRFLLIKEGGVDAAASRNLTVVLNWTEELKRLVPTR